ncbi:MAG: ABC transporter ATP-binding protein [Treponema sp.]|nr:ABC transporter ATP-binding protein [Treponema sp.]
MSFLSIENLCFAYGKTRVIENFSLQVEEGSFTTLLGASGCGKTTLLRLISGFLEPDSGTIKIDGKIINGILPNKRKIGFVFQDYALFPHLTVEQNLFYGLNLKKRTKETKSENKNLVAQTAENLGLLNLLNRFPSELSGGQQQRVALGRVLVLQPSLLLMDEPLSSLDTNLRLKVREELKEIQKKLKITTVYVTHDQEEALSLSDKIAVMKDGKLLQYGTPQQVYFEPKDSFTAEFVGQANFVNGKMFRPEWLKISKNSVVSADFTGTVIGSEFLGAFTRYKIQLENQNQIITADEPTVSAEEIKIGDKVGIFVLKKCDLPIQEK